MVKERLVKHHHSLTSALAGLAHTARAHPNFGFHLVTGVAVLLAAIFFQVSRAELLVLLFTIFLVIFAEMVNTALEEMTDLISQQHSAQARVAKDVSAGMVLLAAFASVVVGLIIFGPRILSLLGYVY